MKCKKVNMNKKPVIQKKNMSKQLNEKKNPSGTTCILIFITNVSFTEALSGALFFFSYLFSPDLDSFSRDLNITRSCFLMTSFYHEKILCLVNGTGVGYALASSPSPS